MLDKSHSPILVTGVERSGSSLIARIFNMCGAFAGETTGMSENIGIKSLVDDYYAGTHLDIRGQYPLPKTNELLIPSVWQMEVAKKLRAQGYEDTQTWLYKSSRISQIYPIWNIAFPSAKWIIVRRANRDIVSSCLNTGTMTAYESKQIQKEIGVDNERDGWLWWIKQHESIFINMMQSGLNCKVVWPERMVQGDYRQLYEVLDWVGLKWNPKIVEFLDRMLHNKNEDKLCQ